VIIAGGGTGGHVFPALALADELRAAVPSSEVLFVGSRGGLEEKLVPSRGYPLHLLRVGKLRRAGVLSSARTLATLPGAGLAALQVLRRFAPHVVVGVGGYASGPVVLAAAVLRRPIVVLEQNSVPGTTNRILSRLADRVVIAFRHAARYLPEDRTLLLGNPVRLAIRNAARPLASEDEGGARGSAAPPCLLVLGGSQGARAVNDLVCAAAPALAARLPQLRIIHQTGSVDETAVRERYQAAGLSARVEAFVEDMSEVYGQADLVVSRAGATTLAELGVVGVPAVLIPFPFAADDHQAENAAEIAEAGGALTVRQEGLTAEGLGDLLGRLLEDRRELERMRRAMRSSGYPDAASAVVNLLLSLKRRDA
jgi:UDP-N-acetylglucosamine--N-acetylmuramyl-(pentapeptide) pyrophosphoryl-undecaprenol N-acetylglucosamine transferase